MNNRHKLEVREVPGGRAFYIDGSLQFDTRDEAVYHEALALPALALAAARFGRPVGALVLGGGDGLALRRLLEGRRTAKAELADYDPGVLELGRGEFAPYNRRSLSDPRVRVYARDARRHLRYDGPRYDLALADFTFPDGLDGCALFTRAFFSAVRARLAAGGVFAMNAVSPDRHPAAFWSLYRTLEAARLYPRPLRVPIPSFSAHGYGDWGMFLASPRPIRDAELRALRFGRNREWLDAASFREALRLRVSSAERGLPLSAVIRKPGDLLCLVNAQEPGLAGDGPLADFGDSAAARRLLAGIPGAARLAWPQLSSEWELRLRETLALLDWDALLEAAEALGEDLPAAALAELRSLRTRLPELLKGAVHPSDRAWQSFALLLTLLVFVNMAYPDNAFAKGYYGSSRGGGSELDITFFIQTTRSPFHHAVYQGPTVAAPLTPGGAMMRPEPLRYRPPASPEGTPPADDRIWFSVTDEAAVSKEGELFLRPGPQGYLLNARRDRFTLYGPGSPEPLFEFCPDQGAVQPALEGLQRSIAAADKAVASYEKWLSWAAPAKVVSGEIRAHGYEAANAAAVRAALAKAAERYQSGGEPAPFPQAQPQWQRLAPGVYLVDDTEIALAGRDGAFYTYPYLFPRGRFAAMAGSPGMDDYLTNLIRRRALMLGVNQPLKAVLQTLLDEKEGVR